MSFVFLADGRGNDTSRRPGSLARLLFYRSSASSPHESLWPVTAAEIERRSSTPAFGFALQEKEVLRVKREEDWAMSGRQIINNNYFVSASPTAKLTSHLFYGGCKSNLGNLISGHCRSHCSRALAGLRQWCMQSAFGQTARMTHI